MKDLDWGEKTIYIIACILSLGFWWIVKIVIKKAMLESDRPIELPITGTVG